MKSLIHEFAMLTDQAGIHDQMRDREEERTAGGAGKGDSVRDEGCPLTLQLTRHSHRRNQIQGGSMEIAQTGTHRMEVVNLKLRM